MSTPRNNPSAPYRPLKWHEYTLVLGVAVCGFAATSIVAVTSGQTVRAIINDRYFGSAPQALTSAATTTCMLSYGLTYMAVLLWCASCASNTIDTARSKRICGQVAATLFCVAVYLTLWG